MPNTTDLTPEPAAAALELLRARFARVPDARRAGHVRHRIDAVLIIAFCSMLSDNDAFTDMEVFGKTQVTWLRTFLSLPHGPPSHDVFRNVFMLIKPQTLLDILADWCGELAGRQIKIDGKALRGSSSAASKQDMVHILRAWVSEAALSAGHVTCTDKSNEREAQPRLLAMLALKDTLVSIDAMGTHPDIAAQIHEAGGDYLPALKGNQKGAHEAVQARFAELDAIAGFDAQALAAGLHPGALLAPGPLQPGQSAAFSHGRYEQRICTALEDLSFFDKSWKWAGLRSVVRLIRTTSRGPKREELTIETHYYLSSLPADAPRLAAHIRAHWSVESFHHVLDVTFGEDHCQVRETTAAHNLSILREMSAQTLRHHLPKQSIRSKRKRAALDSAFRSDLILSINRHPSA